jgi:flagellar assembly protein FliH
MTTAAKFLFDVDFAKGADHKPAEPVITLADHAAKIAAAQADAYGKGFAEAQAEARAETDRRVAAAIECIAERFIGAAAALQAVEARLECEAVEVAMAVARKLAPALIAREPFAETAALASECFRQLGSAPHVAVRVNDGLYAIASEKLDDIARASGFEGRLVVLAEPDIALGDCRVEWADGGVNRDSAKIDATIGEAVSRYVSARREFAKAHEVLRRSEHD